jgi:hypothetical protein
MSYYGKNWRGSKWVRLDFENTSLRIPAQPACYAVYMDGALAYVGQSRNLRSRIAAHHLRDGYANNFHTPWGSCRALLVKARFSDKFGDWAMRELRLIKRLRPPQNVQQGGAKRASRRAVMEIHPRMWGAA